MVYSAARKSGGTSQSRAPLRGRATAAPHEHRVQDRDDDGLAVAEGAGQDGGEQRAGGDGGEDDAGAERAGAAEGTGDGPGDRAGVREVGEGLGGAVGALRLARQGAQDAVEAVV